MYKHYEEITNDWADDDEINNTDDDKKTTKTDD